MFSFKFSKMGLCSVSQIPHPKLDLPDTSDRTVNLLHSVSIFSLTLTPLKPLSRGEGGFDILKTITKNHRIRQNQHAVTPNSYSSLVSGPPLQTTTLYFVSFACAGQVSNNKYEMFGLSMSFKFFNLKCFHCY